MPSLVEVQLGKKSSKGANAVWWQEEVKGLPDDAYDYFDQFECTFDAAVPMFTSAIAISVEYLTVSSVCYVNWMKCFVKYRSAPYVGLEIVWGFLLRPS